MTQLPLLRASYGRMHRGGPNLFDAKGTPKCTAKTPTSASCWGHEAVNAVALQL